MARSLASVSCSVNCTLVADFDGAFALLARCRSPSCLELAAATVCSRCMPFVTIQDADAECRASVVPTRRDAKILCQLPANDAWKELDEPAARDRISNFPATELDGGSMDLANGVCPG